MARNSKEPRPSASAPTTTPWSDPDFVIVPELRSEFIWRLTVMTVVGAVVGAVLFAPQASTHRAFIVAWAMCGCMQMIMLLRMIRVTRLRSLEFLAGASVCILVALWVSLLFAQVGGSPIRIAILFLLMLGVGTMPWRAHASAMILIGSILLIGFQALLLEEPLLVAALGVGIIVVMLRTNVLAYMGIVERASVRLLALTQQSNLSATAIMRLLARCLALMVDTRRTLLITDGRQVEIVSDGKIEPSHVDVAFPLELEKRLKASENPDSWLSCHTLGRQFEIPLLDWFGYRPRWLFCSRFEVLVDQREERVLLIVPCSPLYSLALFGAAWRRYQLLTSIARANVFSARTRTTTSDVVIAAQRDVTERENELNQIVHLVNNVAQEVTVVSEGARTDATRSREAFDRILSATRRLSSGVSDVKWLRELRRVRDARRTDCALTASLLPEICEEVRERARTQGFTGECDVSSIDSVGFRVVSREFFSATMRLIVRTLGSRIAKGGRLHLRGGRAGEYVEFIFEDTGPIISESLRSRMHEPLSARSVTGAPEEALHTAAHLVRLSGGEFLLEPNPNPPGNRLVLRFVMEEVPKPTTSVSGQWALLVDDSAEVLTFYSRIAQAVGCEAVLATTLAEAEAFLEQRGDPRFMVTDLQLGDGDGIRLVRRIRERCGAELPVIVVSGNVEEGVAQRMKDAGATTYFTKPVGRRKLFLELQRLLGGAHG